MDELFTLVIKNPALNSATLYALTRFQAEREEKSVLTLGSLLLTVYLRVGIKKIVQMFLWA